MSLIAEPWRFREILTHKRAQRPANRAAITRRSAIDLYCAKKCSAKYSLRARSGTAKRP